MSYKSIEKINKGSNKAEKNINNVRMVRKVSGSKITTFI